VVAVSLTPSTSARWIPQLVNISTSSVTGCPELIKLSILCQ
jgi:hypothetical protein